jgi:hypothetical protein
MRWLTSTKTSSPRWKITSPTPDSVASSNGKTTLPVLRGHLARARASATLSSDCRPVVSGAAPYAPLR